MAVTRVQSEILRLLAASRRASGESYVAGGVALNLMLAATRRSQDIDLFHDSVTALQTSWDNDRKSLTDNGYQIELIREARNFVEALLTRDGESTLMQWTCDSAFRFFPLVENELLGLTLHPFDLATNKVLAMAGRAEVRDWLDVLQCNSAVQPFGYLVWAACGKDPGYNPQSLIAQVARAHYSQTEVSMLDFDGYKPDAAALGKEWHRVVATARIICDSLPPEELGKAVLTITGTLYSGNTEAIPGAIERDELFFHEGRIGGAWPEIVR